MVWDGDEELYEIQMPGGDNSAYLENDTAQVVLPSFTEGGQRVDQTRYYGRVAYTHALGIDQPIAITRMGYADRVNDRFDEVPFLVRPPFMVSPLWNERGQMYKGTFANGNTGSCQNPSGVGADTVLRCIHFGSPASWFAYDRPKHKPSAWQGLLLQDRAEESGILYRRNRYYDPEKGKFTQEDPIGLAGGINLYGFAGGDPVSLSDPFGLCPEVAKEGAFCLDLFIQSHLKAFPLQADGRGFDPDAPFTASRAQILIDPATTDAIAVVSPSCFAGGIVCKSARLDHRLSITEGPDGSFSVAFRFKNSLIPGPDIDGTLTFARGRNGEWVSSGNVTAFPSNAMYHRVGGQWVQVKPNHNETLPTDLVDGARRNRW